MQEDTRTGISALQGDIARLQYHLDYPFSGEINGIAGSISRSLCQMKEQLALLERYVIPESQRRPFSGVS